MDFNAEANQSPASSCNSPNSNIVSDAMPSRPGRGGNQQKASAVCDFCGNRFYRSPSGITSSSKRKGKNNYCSRACMAEFFKGKRKGSEHPRWVERTVKHCMFCNTEVIREEWQGKVKKLVFCNRKCFSGWKSKNWSGENNPAWRGGGDYYYGSNWARQSQNARVRDSHQCRFCGMQESKNFRKLDVHHIKPFRFFGDDNFRQANKLSNLISLCPTCHCFLEKISASGKIEDAKTLLEIGLSRLKRPKKISDPEWIKTVLICSGSDMG